MRLKPPDVYVADTGTPKGRGVFAGREFAAGEQVEECPVVPLSTHYLALPQEIQRIIFNWGVLTGIPAGDALVLGYGSMYNHDDPANLRYEAHAKTLTMRFIAVRAIPAGEELTINYNAIGGGPSWEDNNWFARMNVKPMDKSS